MEKVIFVSQQSVDAIEKSRRRSSRWMRIGVFFFLVVLPFYYYLKGYFDVSHGAIMVIVGISMLLMFFGGAVFLFLLHKNSISKMYEQMPYKRFGYDPATKKFLYQDNMRKLEFEAKDIEAWYVQFAKDTATADIFYLPDQHPIVLERQFNSKIHDYLTDNCESLSLPAPETLRWKLNIYERKDLRPQEQIIVPEVFAPSVSVSEKKSVRAWISTILGVLILLALSVARCSIRQPNVFKVMQSTWLTIEVTDMLQKGAQDESYLNDPVNKAQMRSTVNKALALYDKNWKAWVQKGTLMTLDQQPDSACMCFRKALKWMDDNVEPERKCGVRRLLVAALRESGQLQEAIKEGRIAVKEFPESTEVRAELMTGCQAFVKQLSRESNDDTPDMQAAKAHEIAVLAESLHKDSLWAESVWVANRGYRLYPFDESLQRVLRESSCEWCDDLLAHSENTDDMWYLSSVIWNIDRKRGLNLRRKCARLGDQTAIEWFNKKGYEWD